MARTSNDVAFFTVGAPDGPDCAEQVLDKLEDSLRSDGWQLGEVLALRVYYTAMAQYGPFSAVRGPRFRTAFGEGGFPATTGLVTGPRPGDAAIEIEALASRQRRTANSSRVYSTFPNATMPPAFVHLAERDDLVVLSGQTGFDVTGSELAEGARDQAAASLANLRYVLEDAGNVGATLAKLRVYVTEAEFVDEVLEEVARFVGGLAQSAPPDVVTLVVDALFKPGVYVEVEAIGTPGQGASAWVIGTGRAQAGAEVGIAAVEQALADAERVLRDAGLSLADVLSCTVWVATADASVDVREHLAIRLRPAGLEPVIVPMELHDGPGGSVLVEVVARPS